MADPINTAAEKLLIALSKQEDLIDDAAVATYEGEYWTDLSAGDGELLRKCLAHTDLTYAKVARLLADKLRTSADEAEIRASLS